MDEETKKKLLKETEDPEDQKRVLLFEDDDEIREMLHMTLQAEGFKIRSAPSGLRALDMALQFQPHVIITDVMMPGGGGYDDVVRKLRSDPTAAEIPVIVFTGKNFDETTRAMFENEPNVKALLNKPISHDEMIENICKVLGIKSKYEKEREEKEKDLPDIDMKDFNAPW